MAVARSAQEQEVLRQFGIQDPGLADSLFAEVYGANPLAAQGRMPNRELALAQFLERGRLEQQLGAAGVRSGGASDTSRALLAMQQGIDQTKALPRTGGGRIEDLDIPIQPQDLPPALTPNSFRPAIPRGVRPEKPQVDSLFNENVDPLRRALNAARMRSSAQSTERAQFGMDPQAATAEAMQMGRNAVAPGIGGGLSPEVAAAWAGRQGAFNLTTPQQTFNDELRKATSPLRGKSMNNLELTQSILGAFAQGQALDKQVQSLSEQMLMFNDTEGAWQAAPNAAAPQIVAAKAQLEQAMKARSLLRERFEREYKEFVGRQPELKTMQSGRAYRTMEGSIKERARRLASIIGLKGPAGMDPGEAVMSGMTPTEIYDTLRKVESGQTIADLIAQGA